MSTLDNISQEFRPPLENPHVANNKYVRLIPGPARPNTPLNTLPIGISHQSPTGDTNKYQGKIPGGATTDKELYRSLLGTPVYADITFKGATYTNSRGKRITFQDVKLSLMLITVSQAKIIEKTSIQGSDGTIKEYIGLDDYQVQIDGILAGANGHYPVEELRSLKAMLDAPIAIDVVSRYLQNFDIYQLVVEDYAFDQEAGGYSKQNFSMSCISDMPTELIIQ